MLRRRHFAFCEHKCESKCLTYQLLTFPCFRHVLVKLPNVDQEVTIFEVIKDPIFFLVLSSEPVSLIMGLGLVALVAHISLK